MSDFLNQLSYWHWWIFAVVLIILEIFSPAAFFIWLGVAGGVTGLVLLIAPEISWPVQFIIFSVFSIVAVWLGRSWFKINTDETDHPFLNEPSAELVGRICKVEQAISGGEGRIIVGDSTWKALGPDAEIGTKVRIVSADTAVLTVELV
ncbi:MAG TPA: NfeD family protein [Leucothrix mucor]|nr:NfeD family protein [Leucothrix mucor]